MANPIATYIYDSICAFQHEMIHKIAKFHAMVAESNIHLETFDKRKISIVGQDYKGVVMDIYWSYFDPFIKDYISRISEEIRIKSIDSCVDVKYSLNILRENLYNMVKIIYEHIARDDRAMRGKGFPKRVALRSVDSEIDFIHRYIDEKIDAQIDIANKQKRSKRKEFILEHLDWWALIIIVFMCWLCQKMNWSEVKFWLDKIYEKL